MIDIIKEATVGFIYQGTTNWIGFLFIILVWGRYLKVELIEENSKKEGEVHWLWTWAWTFVMVLIGYNLIRMIGGMFFQ